MPPIPYQKGLIYIPTWGRRKIYTVEEMSLATILRTRLVVAPGKWSDELRKNYGHIKQIACPVTTGAADAKQWILDNTPDEKVVTIMDDDLTFQQGHMEGTKKKFRKATPIEIHDRLGEMISKAAQSDVGFTSCSTPFFNLTEQQWKACQQICGVFCINRETMEKSKARFNGVPTREDVHFSALTWSAGYPSYSHMFFGITNCGDSSIGGESSIDPDTKQLSPNVLPRGERTKQAHILLAQKFPKFIRLYELVNARTLEVGCTLVMKTRGLAMYRDGLARRERQEARAWRDG